MSETTRRSIRKKATLYGSGAAAIMLMGAIFFASRPGKEHSLSAVTSTASESNTREAVESVATLSTLDRTEVPPAPTYSVPEIKNVICVDGSMNGSSFEGVNCRTTVDKLSEAVENVGPGTLIVVRAFSSDDENSIRGMGTYRDHGLQNKVLNASVDNPIIIQAEGFDPAGGYVKPIVDGAVRVEGLWTPSPGSDATWQIPFDRFPAGFYHVDCVERIWVSRTQGKTELADFPLTRPLPNQGNLPPDYSDCANNTNDGIPLTPADVDGFPGSYLWLDGILYVHLPGGEDPNEYTLEVPHFHPFSSYESAAGVVIRGFRVYHSLNGIDFFSCGTSPSDRCEASHNETSFNFPYGLQPGPYSYLHHNSGRLNTLQLIKIVSDYSEISYNDVGPQLSHGFKLYDVLNCAVHHNNVYGNIYSVSETGTQSGWSIVGTRDVKAGIYIKEGTQECAVYENTVFDNINGIYIRHGGDDSTRDNLIEANKVFNNVIAMRWREPSTWQLNFSTGNFFSAGALFRWGDQTGSLAEYANATGQDRDSQLIWTPRQGH